MKHCDEYVRLSEYADDELCQTDKRLVEEHTSECDNCAALLEINREISVSISRSMAPVPEALRLGVMNRIRSESEAKASENKKTETEKKHRWNRLILTRYVPAAACLVVMLLVWQFWGNIWSTQNDYAAPSAMRVATDEAYAESAMEDSTFGGSAEEAPAFADEDAGLGFAPGMRGDAAGDFDGELFLAPQAEAAEYSDMNDLMMPGEPRTEAETARIMTYIDEAYVQIYFTGELPASLKELEPQSFGSWFGWQKVFEIPSEDVSALLAEIGTRRNLDVIYNENHRNSEYALIFFSQGQ